MKPRASNNVGYSHIHGGFIIGGASVMAARPFWQGGRSRLKAHRGPQQYKYTNLS